MRWTSAPRLILIGTVMPWEFFPCSFTASSRQLSSSLLASIRQDLAGILGAMTGGRLNSFGSIAIETPRAGSRVNTCRTGSIVVYLSQGLTDATGFGGYGQAAWYADRSVAWGRYTIDFNLEQTASRGFRRGLRIHELGHALGYDHVTGRGSIMHPTNLPSNPTTFDQTATRIGFQRPPGNRPPDNDPNAATTNLPRGPITMGPILP